MLHLIELPIELDMEKYNQISDRMNVPNVSLYSHVDHMTIRASKESDICDSFIWSPDFGCTNGQSVSRYVQ